MKALLPLVIFVLACVPLRSAPQPRRASFIEAEYAPYGKEGSGTITGQAFLKTMGGDVKYGAGNTVFMNPVTSYSTEWFERAILAQESLEPSDPRCQPYTKSVIADGEGRFEFEGLPAGEYYIGCLINWSVPGQYGMIPTGGVAHAKVRVAEGQHVRNVIATR